MKVTSVEVLKSFLQLRQTRHEMFPIVTEPLWGPLLDVIAGLPLSSWAVPAEIRGRGG